ncbi:unnamed protein product [Tilletia caries]|nr:unnamed protein product [Tilletia caries]
MSDSKITSVETMRKAVPEFDGTNWKDFAFSVRTTLKGNGCWKPVEPGIPPPKTMQTMQPRPTGSSGTTAPLALSPCPAPRGSGT